MSMEETMQEAKREEESPITRREGFRRPLTVAELRDGQIVRCIKAPLGCEAHLGLTGNTYDASGRRLCRVWTMTTPDGFKQVDLYDDPGYLFEVV